MVSVRMTSSGCIGYGTNTASIQGILVNQLSLVSVQTLRKPRNDVLGELGTPPWGRGRKIIYT